MIDFDDSLVDTFPGQPRLRNAGAVIDYTEEMEIEYGKCILDPIYFVETYAKIVHVDRGLINFLPYEYQKKIIRTAIDNRYTICKLPRQAGKDLVLTTLIPTPSGFKPMGDIHVGDTIFDSNGKPTTVTYESEIFTKNNIYRITFDDGSWVDAGGEHLWTVYDRLNQSKKTIDGSSSYTHRKLTLSTEDILKSNWKRTNKRGYTEYAYYIPNTKPVQYMSKSLDLDPYILGVWLGDGTSISGNISCHIDHKDHFEANGLVFTSPVSYERNSSETVFTSAVSGLVTKLRKLNLIGNKHIPSDYAYGDVNQRIALLQGLMDTDGFVQTNGTCHIQLSLSNQRLLDEVYSLICSLGLKVTRKTFVKTNSERLSFSVGRDKFDVCRIPHKLERQKQTLKNDRYVYSRTIQKIERIETAPSKCIQVDNAEHLFLCSVSYIPTHNTTVIAALMVWMLLFNKQHKMACLAHKEAQAREILDRIKLIYENLPKWLQQGVTTWNRTSIELQTGSKIEIGATSSGSIRGKSFNVIYLDEFAFIPPNLQEEFYTSVLPTISSGKTSKIIITSTPKGFNLFYKIWKEAIDKRNQYVPIEINWNDPPDRDEEWKKIQIGIIGEEKFNQEYNTDFIGSSATLIRPSTLKAIPHIEPINPLVEGEKRLLSIFKDPDPNRMYVVSIDSSDGVNRDYSTFCVIDITQFPYEVVATYRNNRIEPLMYPDVIYRVAKHYNEAYVVAENNNMGQQVCNVLFYDYEYENIFSTVRESAQNEIEAGARVTPGLRTKKNTKRIGCSNLKTLIENNQLITNDFEILSELSRFIKHKDSYRAEEGQHDDLVMCLVIFAWITTQPFFKDISDTDMRINLQERRAEEIQQTIIPFGFIDAGIDEDHAEVIDLTMGDFERFLLF